MKPEHLLESCLGLTGWEIRKPPAGLSKISFVARSADKMVFLKLDVSSAYLHRLSELGITPRILASGMDEGTPFIIQEYFPGHHPTALWFCNHLADVAGLMNKYHRDETLARLLKDDHRVSTASSQVAKLDEEFRHLADSDEKTVAITVFEQLKKQFDQPVADELTPVHTDPNQKNFLVDGPMIQMIDWDDVVLSDPRRDSALICYWYLPENQWPEFLERLGIGYSEEANNWLYWWVGIRSLEIFLWFGAKGQNQEMPDFLEDAKAAAERRPNPHAHFERN
jgi:thiamine kinase-like enzyme